MRSRTYKISIVLILVFMVLVGAKVQKKRVKKNVMTFDKLRGQYLIYKNSNRTKDQTVLRDYMLKFQKYASKNNEKEQIQSLYYIADIYEKLHDITKDRSDLIEAYNIYYKLSRQKNSFGFAAQKKVAILKDVVARPMESQTEEKIVTLKDAVGGNSAENIYTLKEIKFLTSEDYTRVVVELSGEAQYEYKLLKEDPGNAKPKRIFIDIQNTQFADPGQSDPVIVRDNLIEQIRAGRFKRDVLRVVLDIRSLANYKVFALKEPYRIVIDIYGKEGAAKQEEPVKKEDPAKPKETAKPTETAVIPDNKPSTAPAVVINKLGVRTIIIDAGHGGTDPGAIGIKGIREKDIVLDVALKLGKIIKDNFPDIAVHYTREDDTFYNLEDRPAIANTKKADLFVSIHANASKNQAAHGIETYYLSFAKDKASIEVAARENATTEQGVDEVQNILRDLIMSSKFNESSLFASLVQKNLISKMNSKYNDVKDLGVKQAPFYVLIGAGMPSILVELSFITHKQDGVRLADGKYRTKLAEGIFEGVKEYILKTTSSTNTNYNNEQYAKGKDI